MSKSITISYELNPPSGTDAPNLSPSKTREFEVKRSKSSGDGQKEYYESLSDAIGAARDQIGEDFTAWRDAVGNRELSKETKKTLKYDEVEEDDEDDEQA